MDIDEAFGQKLFESATFDVDKYVQSIAMKSLFSTDLVETKEKLNRNAEKTAEEIKLSVYNNYANFMDTSKEVGHLEGKMTQLRQSLDEQRKLLSLFKNINVNETSRQQVQQQQQQQAFETKQQQAIENSRSTMAMLLEEVEGCGVVTQKAGRELLYHGDLEALNSTDFVILHRVHAYLLTDALLITLPLRKRAQTKYKAMSKSANQVQTHQYKFQAFYELQDINITNLDDRREVRNAFQILKFPESLIFRCANAHLKKEWLENMERAKKQLEYEKKKTTALTSTTKIMATVKEDDVDEDESENTTKYMEQSRNKQFRDLFSEFDIYLAQRDFENAVDLLLRIKSQQLDSLNELIYKQKENELINMLRKDLNISKERGNKGIMKTGKRVVLSLVKLRIYDEALNLFIDYHKTINSETLKKIKLEESNSIYMNNVLNTFFDNIKNSFYAFKEAFQQIVNNSLSTYMNWIDTEIEILIRKLESQHYIGRQFNLTIENCELIFEKANIFSQKYFEVKFLFEIKLCKIIESSIKEQQQILYDTSTQRFKLDDLCSILDTFFSNEQNKQIQIHKFFNDLESRGIFKRQKKVVEGDDDDDDIENDDELDRDGDELAANSNYTFEGFDLNQLNAPGIQFSRAIIIFFIDIMRIYYQDINYSIIEATVELFKFEIKNYERLSINVRKLNDQTYQQLYKPLFDRNMNFILNYVLTFLEKCYEERTKIKSKYLDKLHDKYDNFINSKFKHN